MGLQKVSAQDDSFVNENVLGKTSIIRVSFYFNEEHYEDVSPLNGNRNAAICQATLRAMGYPDKDKWSISDVKEFKPDQLDLFANQSQPYSTFNGVRFNVINPEGVMRVGFYGTDSQWPDEKLWIVCALAEIFEEYYHKDGVEPRPHRFRK